GPFQKRCSNPSWAPKEYGWLAEKSWKTRFLGSQSGEGICQQGSTERNQPLFFSSSHPLRPSTSPCCRQESAEVDSKRNAVCWISDAGHPSHIPVSIFSTTAIQSARAASRLMFGRGR